MCNVKKVCVEAARGEQNDTMVALQVALGKMLAEPNFVFTCIQNSIEIFG